VITYIVTHPQIWGILLEKESGGDTMEEQYFVDRCTLRCLRKEHPDWSQRKLAQTVGRSRTWVKKWLRRMRGADPEDKSVLESKSRARKHPPPKIKPEVIERILEIRDEPPGNLRRTPGPRTILYYLHRDESLKEQGHRLPRSTRTIWQILDRHQRILRPPVVEHEILERPIPGQEWGIDFKDVSSVSPEPEGKKMHVVEILNVIDHGSSVLVDSRPHGEYNAESALLMVVEILGRNGCPQRITLDRDPRWVGSWSGKDFPSALLRFFLCVGIEPVVCPPKRPDKNPFVERYHRNLKYECLLQEYPEDLQSTKEVNQNDAQHYNFERPSQALTCHNQPPRVAFPEPPQLPSLPEVVDPDRWLLKIHGRTYKRRIDHNGCVQIGKQRYYIRKQLKGRYVVLCVNAKKRQFQVELNHQVIKRFPIKGLHDQKLPFREYIGLIRKEALSEWRSWRYRRTPRSGGGSRCR